MVPSALTLHWEHACVYCPSSHPPLSALPASSLHSFHAPLREEGGRRRVFFSFTCTLHCLHLPPSFTALHTHAAALQVLPLHSLHTSLHHTCTLHLTQRTRGCLCLPPAAGSLVARMAQQWRHRCRAAAGQNGAHAFCILNRTKRGGDRATFATCPPFRTCCTHLGTFVACCAF